MMQERFHAGCCRKWKAGLPDSSRRAGSMAPRVSRAIQGSRRSEEFAAAAEIWTFSGEPLRAALH